ncbi:response regulator [Chrysiogenes arsenatis]|nr:response regulator [Chrysiogenes arsenatis]
MEEDISRFLAAGMTAHLAKPVRKVDLLHTLGALFGPDTPHQAPQPACSRPAAGDFASQSVFNWKWISDNFEGDYELWHSMLERFFQETYPALVQALQQAIADGNQEEVALQLHRLKGLVGLFQAPQAFEKVRALEQKARRGESMTLRELEAIQQELAYTREVARRWPELI